MRCQRVLPAGRVCAHRGPLRLSLPRANPSTPTQPNPFCAAAAPPLPLLPPPLLLITGPARRPASDRRCRRARRRCRPSPPPGSPRVRPHCPFRNRGTEYDAFGLIGTTFRELDWKTLIFFERAVPISPNAWYVSESGMKRMRGGTTRQCDRALGSPPARWPRRPCRSPYRRRRRRARCGGARGSATDRC
jgi:hypothetical protein